jgi:hypothetical protein
MVGFNKKNNSEDKIKDIDSPLPKINKPERRRVTPMFHVETFSQENRDIHGKDSKNELVVNEATNKAVKDILTSDLPKENPLNPISVRFEEQKVEALTYFNPHNCRVYFVFKKDNFHAPNRYGDIGFLGYIGCDYQLVNSTEHLFKNFKSFNICVKKNLVEIRPLDTHFHTIEKNADALLKEENIRKALIESCVPILKEFVSVFGGICDFKIHHWRILENKFQDDKVTKKIPLRAKWRSKFSKKVYNESNIEISDGVSDIDGNSYYENYTKNLLLKEVSPEIRDALDSQNQRLSVFEANLNKVSEALVTLSKETSNMAYNASSHIGLVREAKDAIKKLSETVESNGKLKDLSVADFKKLKVQSLLRDFGW